MGRDEPQNEEEVEEPKATTKKEPTLPKEEPTKTFKSFSHVIIHMGDQSKKFKLDEKASSKHVINGKMTSNTVGIVTELATLKHLKHLMHEQNGTAGTEQYRKDMDEHQKEIDKLTEGVTDKKTIDTRMKHGEVAANLILEHLKDTHGNNIKIENVDHISKEGGITRFTRGIHSKDTQDTNKSDVGVEISGSKLKPVPADNDTGRHFEGFSLKSSAESSEITAANPAIHLYGMLDTENRKLNTKEVSENSLKNKVHEPLGGGDLSAAERGRELDAIREKEGVKKLSSKEVQANKLGQEAIRDVAEEFHNHLTHLTTNEGDKGHALVANMLKKHLVPDSDMPWSKVKVKGDTPEKVRGALVAGSESPLKNILNNKNIKYFANRTSNSPSVQVGYIHPKTGEQITLARYTPKTKSNAYKSNVHGWNIVPSSTH